MTLEPPIIDESSAIAYFLAGRCQAMRFLLHDGGAMLGAFGIGVFHGLQSEYGIDYRYFDVQVGTSCGAWNAAYITADQVCEGINMYVRLAEGFFCGRLIPFNDMAFLEDIARRSVDALCVKTLKGRQQKVYMPLSDVSTLQPKFICLTEEEDPISTLLTGSFIPGLSRPKMDGSCCDGAFTCHPPIALAKTLSRGKDDEWWFISSHPLDYRVRFMDHIIASWIFGFGSKANRRLFANAASLENAARKEIEQKVRSGSLHFICPAEQLPIHWRSKNKEAVEATVELGRAAARRFMRTYR